MCIGRTKINRKTILEVQHACGFLASFWLFLLPSVSALLAILDAQRAW
jgi:hypothetical protein